MYQSNRSFNIHPRAFPGHLTPFPAREEGNLITTRRGWGIWSLASIRADSTWVEKSWRRRLRRQTFMNSKEKIAYLWSVATFFVLYVIGWKPHESQVNNNFIKINEWSVCTWRHGSPVGVPCWFTRPILWEFNSKFAWLLDTSAFTLCYFVGLNHRPAMRTKDGNDALYMGYWPSMILA